jgi:DNA-binding response OmpR family regulator
VSPGISPDLCFDFSEARVLIVERSEAFAEILVQMLMGFGFRRFTRLRPGDPAPVLDGTPADPALVVADLGHHEDPRVELIERVRQVDAGARRSTAVIGMTVNPSVDFVTSVKTCGADYVLVKPFSPATLLKRILWVAAAPPAPNAVRI